MEELKQEKKQPHWIVPIIVGSIIPIILSYLVPAVLLLLGHFWMWLVHLNWPIIGRIALYIFLVLVVCLVIGWLWIIRQQKILLIGAALIIAAFAIFGLVHFVFPMVPHFWMWLVHLNWPIIGRIALYIFLLLAVITVIGMLWINNQQKILVIGAALIIAALVAFGLAHFVPPLAGHLWAWLVHLNWLIIGRISLYVFLALLIVVVISWLWINDQQRILVIGAALVVVALIVFGLVHFVPPLVGHLWIVLTHHK